jgi:hypothetical protein
MFKAGRFDFFYVICLQPPWFGFVLAEVIASLGTSATAICR